ncbi:MAG: NAD(P)-binding domain-containing protein [Candidatus Aminicenantes bacterium]|nr:NAD(P)-binding domain-containing protein [Candidatus Aminicenantes bacterium]MDH5705009.1 NAD(P)-binding domain-containing protein [Candidatus Aminicenantes bacterium]
MGMKKILIADALSSEALEELKTIPDFEVTLKTGMDEDELVKTIPEFNGTVVRSATKVTGRAIEAASNLELIVRAGIGLDNIDVKAAEAKGIQVANTPAATSISVAEHTFGLMLAAVRNHGKANLSMKEHKWEKKLFSGTELYEKTLGIIGVGRIGQEVAKRALAFGMKVIAYDVIEVKTDLDVKLVSWEELLAQADIITLHLPLTEKTKHMISNKEFEMMKDGVILINASRGGTVDEKALLKALDSGKVRAAALDVFEKEPPVEFSLIDHPNVIATPHIGAAAKEGQARAGMEVVKILKERLT